LKYNWDWSIFLQGAADGSGTWLHYLAVGLVWSLSTALAAWVLALTIGSLVGIIRTTPAKWAVRLGNAYVEIFRNIPLLVQMFLWFFVLPELLPKSVGDAIKQMPPPWGSYLPAVLCLGIYTSVRVAEQVRAGIQSLPRGQGMAGTALGLTLPQTYRYVLLPMAYRVIFPPLTSEFLNIIKNSSVALTIGLLELTGRARAMQEFTFKVFEAFSAATVLYLITNLVIVLLMRSLERRLRVPGRRKRWPRSRRIASAWRASASARKIRRSSGRPGLRSPSRRSPCRRRPFRRLPQRPCRRSRCRRCAPSPSAIPRAAGRATASA